jgi:hypothetical protein
MVFAFDITKMGDGDYFDVKPGLPFWNEIISSQLFLDKKLNKNPRLPKNNSKSMVQTHAQAGSNVFNTFALRKQVAQHCVLNVFGCVSALRLLSAKAFRLKCTWIFTLFFEGRPNYVCLRG